jgi:hypothetical protein
VEIDENGVVNPLRVPSPIRDGLERVAGLPPLARLFAVLAAIDLGVAVLRAHGVSVFALGDALLVLLPVSVLWRRRDAAVATPRVLRGTVLIAACELASAGLRAADAWLVTDPLEPGTVGLGAPRLVAGVVILLIGAAGWWMVAHAIGGLRPAGNGWHRLAGLCVALVAIATGIGYLALAIVPAETQLDASTVVLLVVWAASWLVTAYVGWVFVTRAGTAPRRSTWSAAVGAAILAAASIPTLAISITLLATRDDGILSLQAAGVSIQSIAQLVAPFLFVIAFASGLADPGPDGRTRAPSTPAD